MRVVYDEVMVAPAVGYSPSAAKPAAVMAAWREVGLPLEVRRPTPATKDELCLAHDRDYVRGVLLGHLPNGFGTFSKEIAESLPYTTGAMLTAARWAIAERTAVAAPVSGFHHAGYDQGADFCTFNGLMVTTVALQREKSGLRVGILDYDYHYGNGTDDILAVLSVPGVVHITAGEHWRRPEQAADFMANIASDVARVATCDIVLYQAGADPHIDDPLGGFLTTTQLAERDWRVFSGLRARGVPVAWNLAGGYQKPLSRVVSLHENTMRACVAVHQD